MKNVNNNSVFNSLPFTTETDIVKVDHIYVCGHTGKLDLDLNNVVDFYEDLDMDGGLCPTCASKVEEEVIDRLCKEWEKDMEREVEEVMSRQSEYFKPF